MSAPADMTAGSPDNFIWQDREIRFDILPSEIQPRKGEMIIDSLHSVEDTKGNNGEKGELHITNLRLIWVSGRSRKINLSIGYAAVVSINIKSANSRLLGVTQALYVLTKHNSNKFEFIFTNVVRNSPRLFTTVQTVFRAYDTSKLFRDLKLRGAIIKEKELITLPGEQILNKINGVWNLSADQGNLGTFFFTDVRLVWFANLAENFNVSMPYIQMRNVRIRQATKFGPALVIVTTPMSGGYSLGFRLDPVERMQEVFQEISSYWKVYSESPNLGVKFTVEDQMPTPQQAKVPLPQEDDSLADADDQGDALAQYFIAGHGPETDREPEFHPRLGLAIEKLREGVTIEQLWNVL